MKKALIVVGGASNIAGFFLDRLRKKKKRYEEIHLCDVKDINRKIELNTYHYNNCTEEKIYQDILKKLSQNFKLDVIVFAAMDFPVEKNKKFESGFSPSSDELRKVLEVNTILPYTLAKTMIELKTEKTRLILIGSIYGKVTPNPYLYDTTEKTHRIKPAPYSITKTTLKTISMYAGMELGRRGGDSFVISFGAIENKNMSRQFKTKYRQLSGGCKVIKIKRIAKTIDKMLELPKGVLNGGEVVFDGGYTSV